jgi:predicted membrane channel-forming protein YqfA (hemolysin III family)
MKRLALLPPLLIVAAAIALALHGPIAQWTDYHRFADARGLPGLPNALDVLSNLGFVAVALWGWAVLAPRRHEPALAFGWPGWALFLGALLLTAFGSSWYHLVPDNFRLLFDRLPIALACAGLLAAVYADTHRCSHGLALAVLLALAAVGAVLWWYATELRGAGDLRPYVLLQMAPLVLVPLWQAIRRAPRAERIAFAAAIAFYVLAKFAELRDAQVLAALEWISGHTLKHLLATAAAALVVAGARRRADALRRSDA